MRNRSPEALTAWLRKILARTLADTVKHYHRDRRDVNLELSLQADLDGSSASLANWLAADQTSPSQAAQMSLFGGEAGLAAVGRAVERLIEQGRKLAAQRLEAAEADIDYADGRFFIVGTDRTTRTGDEVALEYCNSPSDTTLAPVSVIQSRPVMPKSNSPSATYSGISWGRKIRTSDTRGSSMVAR